MRKKALKYCILVLLLFGCFCVPKVVAQSHPIGKINEFTSIWAGSDPYALKNIYAGTYKRTGALAFGGSHTRTFGQHLCIKLGIGYCMASYRSDSGNTLNNAYLDISETIGYMGYSKDNRWIWTIAAGLSSGALIKPSDNTVFNHFSRGVSGFLLEADVYKRIRWDLYLKAGVNARYFTLPIERTVDRKQMPWFNFSLGLTWFWMDHGQREKKAAKQKSVV